MASIDKFSNIKNPYDVLGVLCTAKQAEIKKAYRAKARKTHPDRNPLNEKDASEKSFQEIRKAYEILSNPQTRKDYDEYLDARKATGNSQIGNFWNKVRSRPDEIKSDIARKKWYDEIKLLMSMLQILRKNGVLEQKRRGFGFIRLRQLS